MGNGNGAGVTSFEASGSFVGQETPTMYDSANPPELFPVAGSPYRVQVHDGSPVYSLDPSTGVDGIPISYQGATPVARIPPEVNRDLAIVIDETVSAQAILALIHENAGEFLTSHRIFDVYQGDAVPKSKKSVALGLTWQHPSRTLSDEEVNAIISSCVNALQDKFNANLRN